MIRFIQVPLFDRLGVCGCPEQDVLHTHPSEEELERLESRIARRKVDAAMEATRKAMTERAVVFERLAEATYRNVGGLHKAIDPEVKA